MSINKTSTQPQKPRFRFAHIQVEQFTAKQLKVCTRFAKTVGDNDGFARIMLVDKEAHNVLPDDENNNDETNDLVSMQNVLEHASRRIELFVSRRNTTPIDSRQWKKLLGLPNKDTNNVTIKPIKNPDYETYVKNCIAKENVVADMSFGIPMHIGSETRYLRHLQKQALQMGATSEQIRPWSKHELKRFIVFKMTQFEKTQRGIKRNMERFANEELAMESTNSKPESGLQYISDSNDSFESND